MPRRRARSGRSGKLSSKLSGKISVVLAAAVAAALTAPPSSLGGAQAFAAPRAAVRTAGKVAPTRKAAGSARVAIGVAGVLRQVEAKGRRTEALSLEEDTAHRIEELLRGPLRMGTTGIYVADARTGQPVFAVHPDDPLNPASNVKLLSTATAIDLLGPDFRYQTRVLGSVPDRNVVRGDVYLLGSYDPTLDAAALAALAASLASAGVTRIEGDVVVSGSSTRDAVYRALVPVEVTAGVDGAPPTAKLAAGYVGYDYLTINVTATTVSGKKARRARLVYADKLLPPGAPELSATVTTPAPALAGSAAAPAGDGNASGARLQLTISGTIGAGRSFTHWLWVRDRGRHAAHLLRAALAAQGVAIAGDVRKAELPSYLVERIRQGELPVVLARHQSAQLADIVASVNKRSINWLADRVIMTAAALKYGELPSMSRAVDAMYEWLGAQLQVGRKDILVDTGSGLSRKTQLSARHIVEVLRSAGGYTRGLEQDPLHRSWLDSLAFSEGGIQDGTLRGRFRGSGFTGRLRGKTGTLSTSIALSGVLEADPEHPLVFSIVTNSASPLPKGQVRAGHDRIIALLGQYVSKRPGAIAARKPEVRAVPHAQSSNSSSASAATAALPADLPDDEPDEDDGGLEQGSAP